MIKPEELIKEIQWEHEGHEEGIRRYRESASNAPLQTTAPGQKLAQLLLPGYVDAIADAFTDHWDSAMSSDRRPKSVPWHWVLGMLEPDEMAVIGISVVLSCLDSTNRTNVCLAIGAAVETQIDYHQWQDASKAQAKEAGFKKSVAERLIAKYGPQVSVDSKRRWKQTCSSFEALDWAKDVRVSVGAKLLTLLLETHPDVFVELKIHRGSTTRTVIQLSEVILNDIEALHDLASYSRPFLLPTLVEPQPWHRDEESGHIKGGYWHLKNNIFTATRHQHTAADNDATSKEFLTSINQVQRTAWKINTDILYLLDAVDEGMVSGSSWAGFPEVPAAESQPKLSRADWELMDPATRSEVKRSRRLWHERQESIRGTYTGFTRKLAVARKMADKPRFYFPHFADFRGRLYPLPQDLNPQSDDVGKALLMFADAVPLGQDGILNLCIHIANCCGKDKELHADRIKFVEDNYSVLESIASDPLRYADQLAEFEDPLQFVAAMRDLDAAMELEDPTEHCSHICVAVDGVCNGMQILSLLGRDPVGARKTNCGSEPVRYDLYNEVADVVESAMKSETNPDVPASVLTYWLDKWAAGAGRKVVKRACMTTPYGVTRVGIADQLISDGHTDAPDEAAYMRDQICDAVGTVTSQAALLMEYFQQCAKILAKHNVTMSWLTPNNLRVTQSYWNTKKREIVTSVGRMVLWDEHQPSGLNVRKNALSAAPNVVHSLDAAMLQRVAMALSAAGIDSMGMIHDSYGTHAGNIDALHRILRKEAVAMFSNDWLRQVFHAGLVSIAPEGVELPEPPKPGDFDITELLDAEYFFS